MEQQKPLEETVRQCYARPDCGPLVDCAQKESARRDYSRDVMGMDLMDFFRQNSDIYDRANRYTHQAIKKAVDVMYGGRGYDPYWKLNRRIETVSDLYSVTDADLYGNIPCFGAKSLAILNGTLTKAGLPPIPRDGRARYERDLYLKPSSLSAKAPSLK